MRNTTKRPGKALDVRIYYDFHDALKGMSFGIAPSEIQKSQGLSRENLRLPRLRAEC